MTRTRALAVGSTLLLLGPAALLRAQPPTPVFIAPFDAGTYGIAIAVDGAGNSYAAAEAYRGGIAAQVVKFSSSGVVLWKSAEFNPTGVITLATDIAVDLAGDSYVAANDLASGTGYLLKYSPDGVQIGRQVAPNQGSPWFPVLNRLVYDPTTGHLYVVENYLDAATGAPSALLLEYDTALNLVSTPQIVPPTLLGKPGALVADKSGNVYVGGWQTVFSASPFYSDFAAVEFSPHLARQSPPQTIHTFNAGLARLFGAAVDGAGRVYGAGDLRDASTNWNTAGVVVQSGGYARTFQAPGSLEDLFVGMTADAAGDAYVAASSLLPSVVAFQVQKYDPAGALLWSVSPFEGLSFGDVITLDAQNNVYAVSSSGVAKYRQGPGALSLAALSPPSQDATVTKTLAAPLKVKVTQDGQPSAGATVRWDFISLPPGTTGQDLLEAPGFPSTVVAGRDVATDANGESAVQVKLGNMTGDYLVAAQVAGATPGQVAFTLHGKLFLGITLSASSIKPVPFTQTVAAENQVTVTAHAYGIGGSTDAVADYPLALVSTPVAFSGGHDHDLNRPDGKFSRANLAVFTTSATGRTDGVGDLFAVFTSTFFSGDELLYASSTIDAAVISPAASLAIKVDDFVLLPNATYYDLRGGTCLHHGPQGPTGCDSPDEDHFGTAATNASIGASASRWLGKNPTLELVINDMSLPKGGGFDIGGNWSSDIVRNDLRPGHCNTVGHCGHRDGRTADVEIAPHSSPQDLAKVLKG